MYEDLTALQEKTNQLLFKCIEVFNKKILDIVIYYNYFIYLKTQINRQIIKTYFFFWL